MGRLFWKFFLCILLAQLTATVGIGGTFWLQSRSRLQARAPDIDSSPPAQMAIDSAAATLEFGGTAGLRGLLAGMQRHRVFAVDESGRELLGRTVKPATLAEARGVLGQPGQRRVVRAMDGADGHRYLLFLPAAEHARGLDAGAAAPPMALELGLAAAQPRPPGRGGGPGEAGRLFHPFVPIAAATLASLLFAALLAWYFFRPIRDLRLAFEAASGGDLAPRFGASGRGDELSDLGRDFDRMSSRLRSLIEAQNRLLHDVSHELRSPLARLQAAIGLAHQQPDKMAASLARIERESERMDKLVGELLTLARLDAGAAQAGGDDISVADLIEDILGDARFEAAAQQRSVVLLGAADVRVIGQADMLARAIENVVRNAIKHSPAGASVQLELKVDHEARRLRIRVLDRGPGVAPEQLHAIFQPFFRGGGAPTEGHGLGLAIAQHVIDAHAGSIAAHNRSGGGLCVEIRLPLAP